MTRVRHSLALLFAGSVALSILSLTPFSVAGQNAEPAGVAGSERRLAATEPSRIWQVPTERESTLAERFVGGVVLASMVGLGTSQLETDERTWIASYAVGAAGGVLLATAARERPRIVPVLLGAAVGSLPLWPLTDPETDILHPLFAIGFITTPLAAAFGQGW